MKEKNKRTYKKKEKKPRKQIRWGIVALVLAALVVAVVILFFPVFQIYGTGMSPTLETGDIVISTKTDTFQTGDIVAFYYNDKILVKRVLAGPGDYVDINDDGQFFVNGTLLEEPYLDGQSLGDTDLYYPYLVPEGRWFLVGDDRTSSLDSRNSQIGDIAGEQIVGKLVFRLWPLTHMGPV